LLNLNKYKGSSVKIILVLLILFFITPINAQEKEYGAGITLKEKTPVTQILNDPTNYEGKKVLVEGKVLDVCQHAGCWMEISGSAPGEKIKVKVKDGEIVFPVEAKGHTALVEGEVYAIEMDKDEAIEFYEHAAEDAGKEFDPSTVTGPVTVYQIKGLGAIIDFAESTSEPQQ
jgi:hypothetical protein